MRRASGPWGSDTGPSFRRPTPNDQQRPGASGSFSSPADRFGGSGDVSSSYQGSTPGQRRPSADWSGPTVGQRPFTGYQNPPPGWDTPPDYHRPFYDRESPPRWGSPSGYQRPPAYSRSAFASDQDWMLDAPEQATDFYNDQQGAAYGRRPTLRSAPGPSWQPGNQSWQQPYPGEPVAYPGDQRPYGSAYAPAAYPGSQRPYGSAYAPVDPALESPMQPPPRRSKKVTMILLAALIILGVVGGSAAYLYIHSRPSITVTSKYMVGSTPAGAATTALHLTGSQFAAHSAVSILLDGQPAPGHPILQSDASGALKGDLTITGDWALGQYSLNAKDASGNAPLQGTTIIIVAQGEANTPGPNGAPADDTRSFTANLTIHQHNKDTGQNSTYNYQLLVTGQPDPAGGKVCNPDYDTGQIQTEKGTTSSGVKYTDTFTVTCSGTYKGGKLTYMQMLSDEKIVYSNGVTCTANAPYANLELDGAFTSPTDLSGAVSSGTPTFTCSNGRSVTLQGIDGTWLGSISA